MKFCLVTSFAGLGKEYALLLASRGAKIVGKCVIIAILVQFAIFGLDLICIQVVCCNHGCGWLVEGHV